MRCSVILVLVILGEMVYGDDRGLSALEAEYAASHGYGNFTADLVMKLTSKKGRASKRELRLRQIETPESVKTMIVFNSPKPIRGTGLLIFSQVLADDDQWLYLPSLKRVKKIASRDRSGPFVGSEFAYEDLADYVAEEFDYQWVREEPCDDLLCDVVKRVPKDPFSGYLSQLVWVDTSLHRIRKIEYFDKEGVLLKKLQATDFRQYVVGERIFTNPHQLHMENVQSGRTTSLTWVRYLYDQGLEESRDFTTNALRRVR